LVIPVVAILALAGLRLVDSGRRALDADLVGELTSLSADVASLAHELHRERMVAAEFLANRAAEPGGYNEQWRRTDAFANRYTEARSRLGDLPGGVEETLTRIDEHLTTLNSVRQDVGSRQASISQAVLRYGVMISDLVAYREEIAQVASDLDLADKLRAAGAFSKAKANASEEQAVAYAALKTGRLTDEELTAFLATLTAQQEALVTFSLAASNEQRTLVERTVTGDAVQLVDQVASQVIRSAGDNVDPPAAEVVSSAVGAVADLMRWTEERIDEGLIRDATALREAVIRQVIIESAVVLVTLALAVTLALLIARSMARSLGRLREGALMVAQKDLPEAVARLRDVQSLGETSPEEIAKQVRDPIALNSQDEIGQVGQAFNVVHREAVRIAAEQAALRTSVSAMFLNLARRSQTLVDRMIGELDQIERHEEDPKRLAQLFQLDHLATRMRRNDENLLVLAGADSSPPRRDDAPLIDALRAAQSEIEFYDRVEFGTVDTDVQIMAHAVNDIVRLVAELMDNATRFSPPNSVVVADGRRIGDYALVQIEDRGLGMTDEQLRSLNERLMSPSTIDVSAFRMMGLAVVARLASRHDVRVELRRGSETGIVANVALPSSILVLPKIRGREPIPTRAPLAVETSPAQRGHDSVAVTQVVPATLADWAPADDAARRARPAVAVGLQVTGTAASAAAAVANSAMPVAGVAAGYGAALAETAHLAPPVNEPTLSMRSDDTTELPIYREMQAAWFRSHGSTRNESWSTPVAQASAPPASSVSGPGAYASSTGYQPAGAYPHQTPAHTTPVTAQTSGVPSWGDAVTSPLAVPQPRTPSDDWRTAADSGWAAAEKAAEPQIAGTTRSGLPKRKPMSQLVPGGVGQEGAQHRTRRSPEEVRGLLSAYHRGVQRGRAGGEASRTVEPDSGKGAIG